MPTTKLYRRGKQEDKKDERDKYERFGGVSGVIDYKRDRDNKDPQMKKYEEAFYVHLR